MASIEPVHIPEVSNGEDSGVPPRSGLIRFVRDRLVEPVRRHWDASLGAVMLLGLSVAFVNTGFESSLTLAPLALEYVRNATGGQFTGDGYMCGAIAYFSFAIANWITPPLFAVLGMRLSFAAVGFVTLCFATHFIYPFTASLYALCVLEGVALALLWSAQGAALAAHSTPQTVARNSGLFWALYQSGLGGVIVSLTYNGDAQLDLKHRALAFGSLAASVLFGAVCMQLVRKRPRRLSSASPDAPDSADASTSTESPPNEFAHSPSDQSLSERNERVNVSAATEHTNLNSDGRANTPRTMCSLALNAFLEAMRLLGTRELLLLCPLFVYAGLAYPLNLSVLGTSFGHTEALGDAKTVLVGAASVVFGVGEGISGGVIFGLSVARRAACGDRGARPTLAANALVGFVLVCAGLVLIFLQVPATAPLPPDRVDSPVASILQPRVPLCLFAVFAFGFGDGFVNTSLLTALGALFPERASAAFSVFKFFQTSAMAAAYVYSGHLLLPYQLLLPLVACAVGVLCMYVLERLAGARLLPAADGERENLERASDESYGVVHSVAANK